MYGAVRVRLGATRDHNFTANCLFLMGGDGNECNHAVSLASIGYGRVWRYECIKSPKVLPWKDFSQGSGSFWS